MGYTGSRWERTDLVSRRGLGAWYMSDAHDSADEVEDSSGAGRNLLPTAGAPGMSGDLNGIAGFNFTGGDALSSSVPFAVGVKHVFAVAAYAAGTFPGFAGLVGGIAVGDALVGNAGTNKFFNFGDGSTARRNDLLNLREAPVGLVPAFVEWRAPARPGLPMDGVRVGQQRGLAAFWVGPVWEVLVYTEFLTPLELLGIHRYFAMKYHLFQDHNAAGLKIFPFPSDWSRPLSAAKQVLMSRSVSGKIKQRTKTTDAKRTVQAQFNDRRSAEYEAALAFHTATYGVSSFVYRDFVKDPVQDFEAYFLGPIEEDPVGHGRTTYSFTIAEK